MQLSTVDYCILLAYLNMDHGSMIGFLHIIILLPNIIYCSEKFALLGIDQSQVSFSIFVLELTQLSSSEP